MISCLPAADLMIALLDGSQVDNGTAWEIGYFYAKKSSEHRIIGIRTDFRRAGESEGAVVDAMIECIRKAENRAGNEIGFGVGRRDEQPVPSGRPGMLVKQLCALSRYRRSSSRTL